MFFHSPLNRDSIIRTRKEKDSMQGDNKWCKTLTSSSDTTESLNQRCRLKTSAYGGIKFTSRMDVQQELEHFRSSVFSSAFTANIMYARCCMGFHYLSDKSSTCQHWRADWKTQTDQEHESVSISENISWWIVWFIIPLLQQLHVLVSLSSFHHC